MKGTLLLFCLLFPPSLFSQLAWKDSLVFSSVTMPSAVRAAADGSVYTSGTFNPSSPGSGAYGVFMTKHAGNGNLIWSDTSNARATSRGLALDYNKNIYTTGTFVDAIHFGATMLSEPGWHGYFIKHHPSGSFSFIKKLDNIIPRSIVSYNDKILLMGIGGDSLFEGSIFPPGENFIAQYDSVGSFDWVTPIGTLPAEHLSCDSLGNSYVVCQNYSYRKLKKFDSSGNLLWDKPMPAIVNYIHTLANGSFYVTGYFSGTATFGPSTVYNPYTIGQQCYLAKADSSGNFQWAVAPNDSLSFFDLAVTGEKVYVTGYTGYPTDPTGGLHLTEYDTSGNFVQTVEYTPGLSGDRISLHGDDVFIAGHTLEEHPAAFVLKIGESLTGADELENSHSFSVYPNPSAGMLYVSSSQISREEIMLNIYDVLSQQQFQKKYEAGALISEAISLEDLAKGIYFIEMRSGEKRSVKKIIYQ